MITKQSTPCQQPDVDPELWFSTRPEEQRRAQTFCRGCDFKAECITDGASSEYGIFGGLLPADRPHTTPHYSRTLVCLAGLHPKGKPGKPCAPCAEIIRADRLARVAHIVKITGLNHKQFDKKYGLTGVGCTRAMVDIERGRSQNGK